MFRPLLLCSRVVALVVPGRIAGLAEVHAELPSVNGLLHQNLPRPSGAGNIDEVGVSKASGLAGSPVDGDTDVHDITNVAEEIIQVLVRHLKRHVSDEESLGG